MAFRDWYITLLDRVSLNDANYTDTVAVLKSAEPVTGYREVRYPKMDRAREAAEAQLTRVPSPQLELRRDVLDALRSPTRAG